MNIDTIITKLLPVKDFVVRYAVLLFIVFVVMIFGVLTLSISHFSNLEPTDAQVDEKVKTITNIKLNDSAIEKIEDLVDKNISIESLFNNGRSNPFE